MSRDKRKDKPMPPASAVHAEIIDERERRGVMSATPERLTHTEEPLLETVRDVQVLYDWPLHRLWVGGHLGRNEETATARHDAGEEYYRTWYYAKLYPLGSRDYRKPYTGHNTDPYMVAPSQERTENARRKWRKLEAALNLGQIVPDRICRATHYIVIDEMEPAKVGLVIAARRDTAQARAVAIEFLLEGLDRLRRG